MNIFEECINRQKRIDRVVRELGVDSIINKNKSRKSKSLCGYAWGNKFREKYTYK